ncbi:MAG: late competence development ComFB family protein [Spirochaetota bacterium]
MSIRNIMEDIVLSTVREVLKKEDKVVITDEYREDICAYVLNRIPPNYVTSERGILHGLLDSKFLMQQKTDILLLIHEAKEVIRERRSSNTGRHLDMDTASRSSYFPHVIGEVVEESTFSKIEGVRVMLLHDGRPVRMMSDSWDNPFITNRGTMSYYHFWPDLGDDLAADKEYEFELTFEHENLLPRNYSFTMKPVDAVNMSEPRAIPIMLLSLKENADTAFLYEE